MNFYMFGISNLKSTQSHQDYALLRLDWTTINVANAWHRKNFQFYGNNYVEVYTIQYITKKNKQWKR